MGWVAGGDLASICTFPLGQKCSCILILINRRTLKFGAKKRIASIPKSSSTFGISIFCNVAFLETFLFFAPLYELIRYGTSAAKIGTASGHLRKSHLPVDPHNSLSTPGRDTTAR